jgi:hypothetical protein
MDSFVDSSEQRVTTAVIRFGGSSSREVAVVTRMRSLIKAYGEVSGSAMRLPSDACDQSRSSLPSNSIEHVRCTGHHRVASYVSHQVEPYCTCVVGLVGWY